MNNIKKTTAIICAALMCLGMAACSNSSSSSSAPKADKSSSAADSSSDSSSTSSSTDTSSDTDSTVDNTANIGEHLKKTAEIFAKGNYTLDCTLTTNAFDGEVKLTRVVRGNDMYQSQQEPMGTHGAVRIDGKAYNFDYALGLYCENASIPELNMVESIINLGLSQTNTHEDDSNTKYVVEEYTYTGDTYITVVDFYFEKESGNLEKYVTTYSVEGQDDVIETRVINKLDNEIDETVFNTNFTSNLVNFTDMTDDQRLGFCQGLCTVFGVTTDNMSELQITTDDLKTIDYSNLFTLIYTYGAAHNNYVP